MNLLELVKLLRESFLDDIGGSGVKWENITEDAVSSVTLRWTNEELTSHINEAIRQVYRRILPVQLYEPDFDIPIIANQALYEFDKRIIRVVGARLETAARQLTELDQQDIWFADEKWETRTGNPQSFMTDYETANLRLYPIPTDTDTLKLFVNRFPLHELDWECNTEEPELRLEWQYPMLNYAAHLAYLKDEANTFDADKASLYESRFASEFPVTSAYADLRKRRTANRGVSYGGIPLVADSYRSRFRRVRNPYGWWNN